MSKTWLYKTSPLMRGPAVRRWQEMLCAFNIPVEVDGAFGPNTDAATRRAQKQLKVLSDGIVGPATLEAMGRALGDAPKLPEQPQVIDGVEVFDYRGHAPPPKNGRHTRLWSEITGIMLHRTACVLGERPQRYFPVNCHIGVTLEGRIVLSHPFEMMIWHGHAPSPWTIGIEFDGNPEGYPGYWWKPGGGPHDITEAQVKAGDVLLKILLDAFKAGGSELKYIYAHRQSSENRECDPGWQCWQKIGVPWMERTGAIPGDSNGFGGTTFGTGFQIPQSWDPRSPAKGFRVR
jgi:hypothetical protein